MKAKTKVKTVTKIGAQGDILFRRVDKLPAGFEPQKPGAQIVVAHSETGHHHTVQADGVVHYVGPANPMICYLQLATVKHADVVHHRPFDTHATMRLLGGPGSIWEVRRQREWSPTGWRRVQD